MFAPTEHLDATWALIRRATEAGTLGFAAKTATMRTNPNAQDPDVKVICVYTYDGEDAEDVRRVLAALREIGITQHPLYWKADATTLAGLYHRSGQRVSRWSCQDFEAPRHAEVLCADR